MRSRFNTLLLAMTVLSAATTSVVAGPATPCMSPNATPVRVSPATDLKDDDSLGYVCVDAASLQPPGPPLRVSEAGAPNGPMDSK